jgi:hypothetical protein
MAKVRVIVGYGEQTDTGGGVWEDVITERPYKATLTRNARHLRDGENLHQDIFLSNSIRIVADAYARDHYFAVRFVEFHGAPWVVTEAVVERPGLTLRLGGIYNGPRATP